jgi:hypothetical protein
MNKKNILAVVVVVVVVVLAIVAGVVLINRKVAKAPEISSGTTAIQTSTSTVEQATSTAVSSSSAPVASKKYVGGTFSLSYPGSWIVSSTSPFSMDDFGGKYQNGMIPMGGAEIDVVTTTVYSSLSEIMTTELMSAVNLTQSTVTIDGVSCKKALYRDTYAAGVNSQDISVYCLHGSKLWKIYFSYHDGDPAAQAHINDFNGVLSSMTFSL